MVAYVWQVPGSDCPSSGELTRRLRKLDAESGMCVQVDGCVEQQLGGGAEGRGDP